MLKAFGGNFTVQLLQHAYQGDKKESGGCGCAGVGLFDMQEYTQVLEQPHLHLDVGNTQETIVYKRLDIFKLRREKKMRRKKERDN